MKECNGWPVGFCSWSVDNDFEQINSIMSNLDIKHIHLDLRPCCVDESKYYIQQIQEHHWIISSTMIGFPQEDYTTLESIRLTGGIVPNESWQQNQQIFLKAIETTRTLGVKYLSTHFGFIDHSDSENYQILLERVRTLADKAEDNQVILLMETGQESSEDLEHFLDDLNHPAVGINFDPANVILYNQGNPCSSLKKLAQWVQHVHIKDAVFTTVPGTWGTEVPWETGQVDSKAFLKTLNEINYEGCLAVEREAGTSRIEDITDAIEKLIVF